MSVALCTTGVKCLVNRSLESKRKTEISDLWVPRNSGILVCMGNPVDYGISSPRVSMNGGVIGIYL